MKYLLISCLFICLSCIAKKDTLQNLVLIHDIWVLTDLKGFDNQQLDSLARKPTLEINSTELSYFGFSGCNQFNGKLSYSTDSLAFLPGPMTKAFCNDNGLEDLYMKAIGTSNRFLREENLLKLYWNKEWLCSFKKVD